MAPRISYSYYHDLRRRITFDGYIFGAGLALLLVGIIMGPLIGTQTVDVRSIDSTFRISPSVFSPTIALSNEPTNYLFQPNNAVKINGTLTLETIETDLDHVLILSKKSDYSKFVSELSALYSSTPPNTSENMISFKENYTILVDDLYRTSIAMNLTDQYEKTINVQIIGQNIILIGIIENWNDTLLLEGTEQSLDSHLAIEVKTSRLTLFIIGTGAVFSGILLIVISVRLKKRPPSDKT